MSTVTPEHLKAFVRHFYTLWNAHEMEAVANLIHPDFVDHLDVTVPPRETHGRAGFLADRAASAQVLQNVHITIDDLVAEGDTVAARVMVTAEQIGPYRGQSPTGEPFLMRAVSVFRIQDGMLIEHWENITVPRRNEVSRDEGGAA